jgi:hypothetical protein
MRWPVAKVTITIEDEFENDEEGRLNVRMAFGRGEMTADTPMTPAHSYYSYGNEQFIWVASDFLGLDHQWGEGRPLLFETMIFEYPPHDNKCWRCSTWAESEKQHAGACLEVESWLIEQGYTFTVQVDEPAAYTEQRKVKRDASFAMLKKLREEMEKPKAAEEKP